jgi:hypothetical protein
VNISSVQGNSSCCVTINGKRYFATSRKDAAALNLYKTWIGLSPWLTLIAHEVRHVPGPGHATGCTAFPLPTDPPGCDAAYNLGNLGSYGVQYWLFAGWATGVINVGIGCLAPGAAQSYTTTAATNANGYLARFVTSAPPAVTASAPYGGPCYPAPP